MLKDSKIFVAGHRGLVGSAIARKLEQDGYTNLIFQTRHELDLTSQSAVEDFFQTVQPEFVFLAAAEVGGILANSLRPADFIRNNLLIQTNVIDAAWHHGSKKLVFLGSSCIYPREAPQPIREDYLLTGPLEKTNDAYAIAKIAGIRMVQAYRQQYGFDGISLMPTNLYGPNDNFDLNGSHVLPALIRKFHEAKLNGDSEVVLWGTGQPRREFLHVDDLADATVFLMNSYSSTDIVNVGTGEDISIFDLAVMVKEVVGWSGKIVHDLSKPDGTPRKLMDVTRLTGLGWKARIGLRDGIEQTYEVYASSLTTA